METHLQELLSFLRFRSVSTDPTRTDDMSQCAQWLYHRLSSIGLEARAHSTGGHPAVVATNRHDVGRPSVMIYGHYDVQPPEPLEEWTHPPFEPHIEEGRIYARGATDNKGQIMAHIAGIEEALERDGELPVNLIVLVEGEEEIGSPHLRPFLEQHKPQLRCDVVAVSDTGMVAPGVPALTYGTRGVAALELRVFGAAHDLHSGIFGGAAPNAAAALAGLLHTLHDETGAVAIEGFYDGVEPLQEWEREEWSQLPVTDEHWRSAIGATELAGEAGFSATERVWGRPTAEINGIGGGFQGSGSKTVIPAEAFAKITFRLVPNQEVDSVIKKAEEHFHRHAPAGIRVEVKRGHGGDWYHMDPRSRFGMAAQRALETTFQRPPALTREGGSIPILSTFREVLGVETLLLGLALPDCAAHAPDENFPVENYLARIKLNQALLKELATA